MCVNETTAQNIHYNHELALCTQYGGLLASEGGKGWLACVVLLQVRISQYNQNTELVYVPGEAEQSKLVDDFGSFKYWREPVPTLDLASILNEVSQIEEPHTEQAQVQQEVTTSEQDGITVRLIDLLESCMRTLALDFSFWLVISVVGLCLCFIFHCILSLMLHILLLSTDNL